MEGGSNESPHRRYNPLTGEWVLVSPHRTARPWDGQREETETDLPPSYLPDCYLCPTNTRAGGTKNPDYEATFVFTNDFAALLASAHALVTTSVAEGFGLAFLEPWLMGRPLAGRHHAADDDQRRADWLIGALGGPTAGGVIPEPSTLAMLSDALVLPCAEDTPIEAQR